MSDTEKSKSQLITEVEALRAEVKALQQAATDHARSERELAVLFEISKALMTSLELNPVLQLVIDHAVRVMQLDTGAIYLLGEEHLYLGAATPPLPPDMPEEFRVTLLEHHPHIGKALASGLPLFLPDTQTEELTAQELTISMERGLRSLLYVPLPVGARMVGVLILGTVGRTITFSEHDRNLSQTIAALMALAVENALLHQRTQAHATELEKRVAERTAELEEANAELRSLSRIKDEFVSNVSHELQSPLTSLKIREELLEQQPEQLQRHLAIMRRETDRLGRMIEYLLQLSRFDQQRVTFNPRQLDLNRLVDQFVADRKLLAEQEGLELTFADGEKALLARADGALIVQALSALVTNAINYTPAGGSITVATGETTFEGQKWAGFSVSDTGPGIAPDDQARIFERFFRGRAARTAGNNGTGLGLAIAKEIVNRHQGQITVESTGQLGKGVTFCVWLPVGA